jgi:GNAT superfamily N-acetyltransferase
MNQDVVVVRPLMPPDVVALPAAYDLRPWPEELNDIPRSFVAFWVAASRRDGVVGFVGMQDAKLGKTLPYVPEVLTDGSSGVVGRICHLAVKNEQPFDDTGRLLVLAAIDWARGRDVGALVAATQADDALSPSLYESLGFSAVGDSMNDGEPFVWWRLEIQRVAK